MVLIHLCLAAIMIQMDPALGDFMSQLRCQTSNRKISSFETVGKGNSIVPVDVIPLTTVVPPVNQKRGRRIRQSNKMQSRQPSMLNSLLQVAQGVQIGMSLEDESVLVVAPTSNLISELMKLQNWEVVVDRTLGEELERTITTVVTKLKNELTESTSSLKATLEAMEAFKEKMRQDNVAAKKVQQALKRRLRRKRSILPRKRSKLKRGRKHCPPRWRSVIPLCCA